jgi:hypothetical protein
MKQKQDQAPREVGLSVSSESPKDERRHHARYPLSATLEGVEVQSKARFSGRISDLSIGGCYVDSIIVFSVGATLKIRLTHDGKTFETRSKVSASTPGMGMSLTFTDTGPEQSQTLQSWISELSGELLPSEPDLPEIKSQQLGTTSAGTHQEALTELILELMRTGVVSEIKGRAILRTLSGR